MLESLQDFSPDPENGNMSSPRGHSLIEESLNRVGAVRGAAADKNRLMIAGNHVLDVAQERDFGVQVVHTTGEQLVVVQRLDLSIDEQLGRDAHVLDNRTSQVSYRLNHRQAMLHYKDGVNLLPFFSPDELLVSANHAIQEQEREKREPKESDGNGKKRIALSVPPDLYRRFRSLMDRAPGETQEQKLSHLLA